MLLYTTRDNIHIHCKPGIKSPSDFMIQYQEPVRRLRTPKHIHWGIDSSIKHTLHSVETLILVARLITMTQAVQPTVHYPSTLPKFAPDTLIRFPLLEGSG